MRTTRQKVLLGIYIVTGIIAVLILLFFIFRDNILQTVVERAKAKAERDYHSSLHIGSADFSGLTGVEVLDLSLTPIGKDTILKVAQLKTSVSFLKLLTGDIQLGTLYMHDGYVNLVRDSTGANFDRFIKRDSVGNRATKETNRRDYADLANRIISNALDLVPTDMQLKNVTLKINDNGKKARVSVSSLILEDKQLDTSIDVQTNSFSQRWRIKGFADPRNNKADIRFFNIDTGAIRLPYFDERYNLNAAFDSIRVNVADIDMKRGELHIEGFTSIRNLKVNHPKIASKDVLINNARFDYHFLLGSDHISVDSSSTVHFNRVKFHPYLSYNTAGDTTYTLKARIPKMKAQDFISSLPDGLFTNFQGMQAEGSFEYALHFMFNKNNPKDLIFDSQLQKDRFRITKYGEANLSKLNGEFVYRAIENGKPQRAVLVGPSNPNYTPLEAISPYLRKAVLTTEDPSFFSHHGFIGEAFRQSIIQNIKTKKFTRGASTISMQLVKNVFLTREKTLSRKLEEILLVYILENNRIASKARMLEVYFNIIEWGPNVYGIGEASRFYFSKHPSELSLNECIFLANIIPRPKGFMWQFNDQGGLKTFAERKQQYLTNIMMRRGLLSADDTIYKSLPVIVSGRASSYIRIREKDTTVVDSMQLDEEFDF